jgi:hypothetical protein
LKFVLFILLVSTKGFDYVKDQIIGSETKDLVEGQWVSSEYGNPKMYIETPKVLTRIKARPVPNLNFSTLPFS